MEMECLCTYRECIISDVTAGGIEFIGAGSTASTVSLTCFFLCRRIAEKTS